MNSGVTLPVSRATVREISNTELEITQAASTPRVIETHGLTLVEGGNTSSNRKGDTSVIYGRLPTAESPLLPQVSVEADRRSRGLSVTLARVGTQHWVAEISGRFQRVRVRFENDEWVRERPI